MRGIQYLNDNNGNRIKAIVDLDRYEKEFAVFLEELSKKYGGAGSSTNNPFGNNPVVGDNVAYIGSQNMSVPNARILKIEAMVNYAKQYFGTPYRTGGTTTSGMDCSGLTQTVFKAVGIDIPRVSRDQATIGQPIGRNELQAGDLIFFATGTPGLVNHVGIVSGTSGGDVNFIHASSSRGVMESSLSLNYWTQAYMGARRVV